MRFRQVEIIKSNITSSLDLQPTFAKFGLITRQLALQSSKYIYRLEIYDFKTTEKLSSVDIYQTYNQLKHFIKFISDYNLVAISTIYEIHFYEIQPLKLVKNILHEQQNIYDLEVSADGQLVVLVGQYIKIWRTNGFRQITFPQVITSARFCAFSNDNKYMAITSNFQINIYTFSRSNGGYLFNQITSLTPPVINGDVTSIQFNPTTSNQLIVGFLNVSPQLLELDTGLFKLLKDIQPQSSLNAKKARYMPDGKRILSSDYINGIGIWPGVNNTLYYKQGYLLYDLRPNIDGTSVLGYVWQQVKFFNIQVQCSPQKYLKMCPCNSNQRWDYYNYNCQPLKCLQGEFATGQIKSSQCTCVSGYKFNEALGKCQIDCSTDDKAITINPNTGYCYCKSNHVWNQNTKSCQFDCTKIPNSSGILLSSAQCQCNTGFIWNSDLYQCICPKYMKQIAGQCVCYDQYYPNPQGKCVIDCNTIVNQNGSLPSQQECQCTTGYFFAQYNDLVGCKLNCTNFNDTLKNSPGFTQCICSQNMNWVNNTCKIDCKNVQYASGASATVANGCNCAVNYLWIDQIHECGKNCSGVANVNQTLHSTLIACPCINSFNWNQDTQKCEIDCTNVKNTNPYSLADPTKCQCRQAFDWNKVQYKCEINCTKIWGASKKKNDQECECDKGDFNKQKLTCESSQTSSLFSSPLAIVGFVISIIIFCIIMLVLIRYCWQFETKNNKEHQKKLKVNDKQPFKPNKKKRLLKNQPKSGTQQMLTDERLRTNNNAFGTRTTV